jgi:hypothetical protein
MNQRKFLDLLDLAWQDFSQDEPSAVGMIIVMIHKRADDEMGLQVGSNVAPEVVRHALNELADSGLEFDRVKGSPLRKVV